jgi:hypothetical protein
MSCAAAPLLRLGPALLLAAALACGRGDPGPGAVAPPTPQAAVSIEPPRLRVGEVAVVEVAVATPPGYAVRPLAPPEAAALGPLWLLDAEALPVDRQGQRWTHRTRLRVRAREVGRGTWPALAIELSGPEGEHSRIETAPRPFEVVSVLPEFADRTGPFPLRAPADRASDASPLAAAAAGAAAALATVAAVALARRARGRRRARAARAEARARGEAPWRAALAELAAAGAGSDAEWRRSADRCAVALRRYAAQRFGFAIESRTTEELERAAPPFALALRWPAALAGLRELDALRFRPAAAADAPERVRRVAEALQRWVAETIPPEDAAR